VKQAPGTALALLANRLQVSEAEVKQSLTETVFKNATQAQMTSLCIVANEYGLNPFVRELYAFPSQNGIVPMVSIDGWLRIINEHPQFAGMDIHYADEVTRVGKSKNCPEYIEVTIHRKDRPHTSSPIREYLDECYRDTIPWNTMTRRMLRHKAIKEAGRVVMGLHGIFDEDEAQDVLAHEGKRIVKVGEDYEVIEGEAVEDPHANPEDVAKMLKFAATKDNGQGKPVSERAILQNLKRQFGFDAPLTEVTVPMLESVRQGLEGLADMPRPATPRGVQGDDSGFAEDSPAEGGQEQNEDSGEMASKGQMKTFGEIWDRAVNEGHDEGELLAAVCDATGAPTLDKLTAQQADTAIKYVEAQL